jgi:hypothetical protein
LGATNHDLNKIPIGIRPLSGPDTDGDGLSDDFEQSQGTNKYHYDTDGDGFSDFTEIANGYSPINAYTGKITFDENLTKKLAGRILLQVQSNGEAWYINPVDLKRYYLGRPADAFYIMRYFGLGITNYDLNQIPVGYLPSYYPSYVPTCKSTYCPQIRPAIKWS